MKSGFVSIVGRPNVGKSTLLNNIIGKKIAITSDKSQTTRNIIQGIYNNDEVQIVFVDTPGIHKPQNKLGKILNEQTYFSINDVDILMWVVDISESFGNGDRFVLDIIKKAKKPVILILNKIDKLTKDEILVKINSFKDIYNFDEIIPTSALNGDNIKRITDILTKYLPDTIQYYDKNTITNTTSEFVISELIREKILLLTNEEVPHSVMVKVDLIEEDKNIINIHANIIVDRENLKKIIIGKQGNMIKDISTKARLDIQEYLGKQVYLETFVKVVEKWRDREKYLYEDFKDFME